MWMVMYVYIHFYFIVLFDWQLPVLYTKSIMSLCPISIPRIMFFTFHDVFSKNVQHIMTWKMWHHLSPPAAVGSARIWRLLEHSGCASLMQNWLQWVFYHYWWPEAAQKRKYILEQRATAFILNRSWHEMPKIVWCNTGLVLWNTGVSKSKVWAHCGFFYLIWKCIVFVFAKLPECFCISCRHVNPSVSWRFSYQAPAYY